jgi:hypothetical protein
VLHILSVTPFLVSSSHFTQTCHFQIARPKCCIRISFLCACFLSSLLHLPWLHHLTNYEIALIIFSVLVACVPKHIQNERPTSTPFIKIYKIIKVKLSLSLTKHHAMKTRRGSGGIAPRILDLGIRWRWVVSFTPRPLYSQGKSPR